MKPPPSGSHSHPVPLAALAKLFIKLGIIGFGGPAAHIALMEEEVVRRRRWIDHQEFLDLLGATNLIPGPTSTEMTLHIGLRQRGFAGMCVAGGSFILPAALLSALFAWAYVRYGALPDARDALAGVQGAVLALIAIACLNLGKAAAKNQFLVILGVAAGLASGAGVREILVLLIAGLIGALWEKSRRASSIQKTLTLGLCLLSRPASAAAAAAVASATTTAPATISVLGLGLGFLGIGSILYGSGYVLFAFLEDWLVTGTHLLTPAQLTDAIAVGQFTPGPVSSTATFIGYLLHGGPGALAATLGMFLPSFVFVLLFSPWLPRLRQNPTAGAFLDAVNIAAVALIAVVTLRLGWSASQNWFVPVVAVVSMAILYFKLLNPTLLIVVAAFLGWLVL